VAEWEEIELISAVKKIKRRFPGTEPCGTPKSIETHVDPEFRDAIIRVRSDRIEATEEEYPLERALGVLAIFRGPPSQKLTKHIRGQREKPEICR